MAGSDKLSHSLTAHGRLLATTDTSILHLIINAVSTTKALSVTGVRYRSLGCPPSHFLFYKVRSI